jgi:hypothetical protein
MPSTSLVTVIEIPVLAFGAACTGTAVEETKNRSPKRNANSFFIVSPSFFRRYSISGYRLNMQIAENMLLQIFVYRIV